MSEATDPYAHHAELRGRIADPETSLFRTFLADHDVPDVRPDLTREEQVRYIAHGAGDLGTSRDYLASIVDHVAHLGIADDHCTDLLREVDAYLAAQAAKELAR
jgi:cation transport protein ChaC